jgi:hypothetical protein
MINPFTDNNINNFVTMIALKSDKRVSKKCDTTNRLYANDKTDTT